MACSAPFEAHPPTTLINNGQYLGVTSTGPKTGGRSIDSISSMERAWDHVSESFGLGVPFKEYHSQIGRPFSDIQVLHLETRMSSARELCFLIKP